MRSLNRPRGWFVAVAALWVVILGVGTYFGARAFERRVAPESYFALAQAREGRIAYAQNCASCHGADLAGAGAPALMGDAFLAGWSDATVAELYDYVHDQMPLGRGGSLSDAAYVGATAYLLYRNGYPHAEAPLRAGDERLAALPLGTGARGAVRDDLAPSLSAEEPELLVRWLAAFPALFAQADDDESGVEGSGEEASDDSAVPPLGDDRGTADDAAPAASGDAIPEETPEGSAEDPARAAEPEGGDGATASAASAPPPSARQSGLGDLRLTVLPDDASVAIETEDGESVERDLDGGTRVVAGLEPGRYLVRAELGGAVLSHIVSIRAGELVESELLFGVDAALPETPNPIGAEADVDADAAPTASKPAAPGAIAPVAGLTLDGDALYTTNCVLCHGPQGGGIYGPALADNPRLDDVGWVARRILAGGQGMPAFGAVLTDAELAVLLEHLLAEFAGADADATVEPDAVSAVRETLSAAQLNPALNADLALQPLGAQRYVEACSACHGFQGGGDVGPPLAGNPRLQDTQTVITAILYGRGIMPAFAIWPDADVAAVASYIRTAWDNDYGPVPRSAVEVYRPEDERSGGAEAPRDRGASAEPEPPLPHSVLPSDASPVAATPPLRGEDQEVR